MILASTDNAVSYVPVTFEPGGLPVTVDLKGRKITGIIIPNEFNLGLATTLDFYMLTTQPFEGVEIAGTDNSNRIIEDIVKNKVYYISDLPRFKLISIAFGGPTSGDIILILD